MTTAWLIRHGQSESNAGLPTAQPGTSRLTELGLEQARLVAELLPHAPALIVTSPFIRAQQTAAVTRERFPHAPLVEWPVHEFNYLAPALYSGTTYHERAPHAQAYWERADPFYVDGEGAESLAELMERVRAMEARLRTWEGGPVAVFSHGLFLRATLFAWLTGSFAVDADRMRRFASFLWGIEFPNCALVEAHLTASGVRLSGLQMHHLHNWRLTS
jgi:broad specificity phosphatase PhoE